MSINPAGMNSYNWNYSKPDREDYSPQLVGTVVAIQEVQKRGYNPGGQPGAPQFWPDGNPMMNIRIGLATPEGALKAFVFQPAGKQARMGLKRSVHMDLFALTGNTDMRNLIGKTICIQTQEGHYGQGNPRPWSVSLVDMGPFQLSAPLPEEFAVPQLLANSAASGGRVTPPAPQQSYPSQHPVTYDPVQARPVQQQAPQPPMQYPQPPVQQYQQQYQQQQMDPAIMASMAGQAFGGPVTVQQQLPPNDPVGEGMVYGAEDGMPY